jgi:colanic acid/amylovoran biosynthesis glycosyltransferase
MRVAYITTMKRGLPSFVYRELEFLSQAGLEVGVFATKFADGLFMPDLAWLFHRMRPLLIVLCQPLHLLRWPRRYVRLLRVALKTRSLVDFLVACDFAAMMKHWSIKSVHCIEGLHALAIGYYCHQLLDLPLSVTIHTDALYMPDDWPIFKTAIHACHFVTTVCQFNREKLIQEHRLPAERVHLVRLGVDTGYFRPDSTVKVLIVAQFSQRKGHENLFRALKKLNRDNIHLWVVGSDTWGSIGDHVDVRQLAHDLDVTDRITFFGDLSGPFLRVLFQNCDIFCLPSRKYLINEGIPVSLMEAMACAKPVISTYHAGIPELVPEILVRENDVSALAEALAFLADRPKVRREMGQRNRKIIQRDYSITNAKRMRELFLTVTSDIGICSKADESTIVR